MLTFSSSVRSGVYMGASVQSWPAASRAAAKVLPCRQLPQYIPPAPAAR